MDYAGTMETAKGGSGMKNLGNESFDAPKNRKEFLCIIETDAKQKTDEKGGKDSKKATGTTTTKKSSEGGGVFQLAATRKAQGEESSVDVGTEEESSGEAGQGFLPKKNISTEPSTEQIVAAGQSQILTQPTLSVAASPTTKTSSTPSVSGTVSSVQTQQTNVAATGSVVTNVNLRNSPK